MRAMKNKVILFGIIIVLVLYIIFLHCIKSTGNEDISLDARLLITTGVWAENTDIEQYLYVLELFDRNDIDAAKKRIQRLLYIRIAEPPDWKLIGSLDGLNLKAQRIELLQRIKQYHEEHKDEIDMDLPSNKQAVQQLDNLI
jgi:hypothetical protein